jgi:hypothetical protein
VPQARETAVALVAAVLCGVAGCEWGETLPTTVAITSYVTKVSPGVYDLVDMEAEQIVEGGISLAENAKIVTSQWIVGHVEGEGEHGHYNFDVLFGPDPDVTGEEGAIVYDQSGFYLCSGWALLKGQCPVGQTERTQAGANGTVLLMQVERTGTTVTDRVYLLAPGSSTVIAVKPTERSALTSLGFDPNWYVENTSSIGPVSVRMEATAAATPDLWDFLQDVQAIATTARLWPP